MTRIGRLTVFLLLAGMIAGCGGDGSSGDQQASREAIPEKSADPAPAVEETEGRPMIPPEGPEAVEGVYIAPYFDAEGTATELAVAPGELFSVYICTVHPGYDMKTAQWKMRVPDGITVLGESKTFPQALSVGTYSEIYMITYPCQTGGNTVSLLKYNCIATEEFQGGEFETVKAGTALGHSKEPPFLGFVTCGDQMQQVPAYGGTATVTRK